MKKKGLKKGLLIYIIIVNIIIIGTIIFIINYNLSDKLVCKSSEGNITIIYNDKTIKNYQSKNIAYNIKEQKEAAKKMGMDKYIPMFKEWFESSTSGKCIKK